jgi:hypothetical protein
MEGCFGMSLKDRNGFLGNTVQWRHFKLVPAELFRSRLRKAGDVDSRPRCLEKPSPHLEFRHDLRAPPRAEYDGILQSDEA